MMNDRQKNYMSHVGDQAQPRASPLNDGAIRSLARLCAGLYLKNEETMTDVVGDADLSTHAFFPDCVLYPDIYGLSDADTNNLMKIERHKGQQ